MFTYHPGTRKLRDGAACRCPWEETEDPTLKCRRTLGRRRTAPRRSPVAPQISRRFLRPLPLFPPVPPPPIDVLLWGARGVQVCRDFLLQRLPISRALPGAELYTPDYQLPVLRHKLNKHLGLSGRYAGP